MFEHTVISINYIYTTISTVNNSLKMKAIDLTNMSLKLKGCIRKQLVCFYMCWMAATGIALTFIILPGYQTLTQFQQTECTTIKVNKSGANPCTFCLQVFVITKEKSSLLRQLQQDEIENNARVCLFPHISTNI